MTAALSTGQFPAMLTYRTARANMLLDFFWHGGPYIDVHVNNRAAHAINVWDYSTDSPQQPFTALGLRGAVWQWLADTSTAELQQYALQGSR